MSEYEDMGFSEYLFSARSEPIELMDNIGLHGLEKLTVTVEVGNIKPPTGGRPEFGAVEILVKGNTLSLHYHKEISKDYLEELSQSYDALMPYLGRCLEQEKAHLDHDMRKYEKERKSLQTPLAQKLPLWTHIWHGLLQDIECTFGNTKDSYNRKMRDYMFLKSSIEAGIALVQPSMPNQTGKKQIVSYTEMQEQQLSSNAKAQELVARLEEIISVVKREETIVQRWYKLNHPGGIDFNPPAKYESF